MNNLIKKGLTLLLTLAMFISQVSASFVNVNATNQELINQGIQNQDVYSQILNITINNKAIKKVTLQLNGKQLEEQEANDLVSFTVYKNGHYLVLGLDENQNILTELEVNVTTFTDFVIEEKDNGIEIISRLDNTWQIQVSGAVETILGITEANYGFKSFYIPKTNGTYTFTPIDKDGKALRTGIDYNVDSFVETDINGSIIIKNNEDLKQIINNPSGSYVLVADIELESDILSEVVFTGLLDGNGYMLSGVKTQLFAEVNGATIKNLTMSQGILSKRSVQTNIENSGFYIENKDTQMDTALILESQETIIKNSYVLMNVEGNLVSGFVLEGKAEIENSYVSGYLNGQEVYGFGKDTKLKNCYVSASLTGNSRVLFTEQELENCFYDQQVNDLIDNNATALSQDTLTNGQLTNNEFKMERGYYPQITHENNWQDKALSLLKLSTLVVKTEENLSTLENKVDFDKDEDIQWQGNNVELKNNSATLTSQSGEIIAETKGMVNRFALMVANTMSTPIAGESTTLPTTQITYPTIYAHYYQVLTANETAPTLPTTHKEAIENGWSVVYWTGINHANGLMWDTDYIVYETDLVGVKSTNVKTNKATIDAIVTIDGNYEVGQTLKAVFEGFNNDVQGTLYFEKAKTLDSNTWVEVKQYSVSDFSSDYTYVVSEDEYYHYIRARFVVAGNSQYVGTFIATTSTLLKHPIDSVTINNSAPKESGKYSLGDKLNATIAPAEYQSEVEFEWYHVGESDPFYSGINYTLRGDNIGKEIMVKAIAKDSGALFGSKESNPTSTVVTVKKTVPTSKATVVAFDDITATITMKDSDNALYKFKIVEDGQSLDDTSEYPLYARGNTEMVVIGLKPSTTYHIYAKVVGEDGYADSDYSTLFTNFTTSKERVQGSINVEGSMIYDKELIISLLTSNTVQTGKWDWYRLDNDGKRPSTPFKQDDDPYTLTQNDIGHQIEIVYTGTGDYAGEISYVTDTIVKAESIIPSDNATLDTSKTTYNSVTLNLPSNSEGRKYIIGYSLTQTGVPVEYRDNGTVKSYTSNAEVTLNILSKDTKFYFFVRYAESDIYQKSGWVPANQAIFETTKKKQFTGTIDFSYGHSQAVPMQGETLTATINTTDTEFNYKGQWSWVKVDNNNVETKIYDFILANDNHSSSYTIPQTEIEGTKYKVVYTPTSGYEGEITRTSIGIVAYVKQPYTTPDIQNVKVEAKSDSSIGMMMGLGNGQYQFKYRLASGGIETEVNQQVYADVEIEVNELLRNTKYQVAVRRIGDNDGDNSAWSSWSNAVITDKTEIAGQVILSGEPRNKLIITATYEGATYSPTGNDTKGTWKWYRDGVEISGQTKTTYTLTNADVGKVISAKYTVDSTSDFTGTVDAKTNTIMKANCELPKADNLTSSYNKTSGLMEIRANLTQDDGAQKVYYRLQPQAEAAPEYPNTEAALTSWQEVAGDTTVFNKDAHGNSLTANGTYVLYMIRTESDYILSSGVVSSSIKVGTPSQTGTVTLSGDIIVDKTVTATLTNANNNKGTWKWYRSKNIKSSASDSIPSFTDESKWVEITSGFSNAINTTSSDLNITSDMWGYFIRADFVANEDYGYSGSVNSYSIGQKCVRRVLEETLTIDSSTKDGNGNRKAYANTKVTATLNNSYETESLSNRQAKFTTGNSADTPSTANVNATTFWRQYSSGSTSSYDNQIVGASITIPNRYYLYVDNSLKDYTNSSTLIKTEVDSNFTYVYGLPISTAADMYNFIIGSGNYTNRASTYVLTANINMSSYESFTPISTYFTGKFNGDYHNITNLKNSIFAKVQNATIHKFIVNQQSVVYTTVASSNSAASVTLESYGGNTFNRVFLSQATVQSGHDTGYFVGKRFAGNGAVDNFTECGSAGGEVRTASTDARVVSGFVGYMEGAVNISNSSSLRTSVVGKGSNKIAGFATTGGGALNLNNILSTSTVSGTYAEAGAIGFKYEGKGTISGANYYYDKTLENKTFGSNSYGTGQATSNLIGTKLSSAFGTTIWNYRTGFYPQLAWLKNNNVANLYAATRAAFISRDGYTTESEKLDGKIYGTLLIPEEFQTKDYTVTSSNSNVLRVVNGNMIVPVGSSGTSATITIKYNEPDSSIGGSATNTFIFTVYNTINPIAVSVSGTPQYGKTLTASASGGSGTMTYQWYRRKSGTTTAEKISGATSSTYNLTTTDIGYEFAVEAKAGSHSDTMSSYTNVVTSSAPTKGPTLISSTDSQITFKQTGLNSISYDIAYELKGSNAKTILKNTYLDGQEITISNLQRNKEYNVYARVTAGATYNASAWSPVTTIKTKQTSVTGKVYMGPNINNGQTMSFTIENTNNQMGTWKLERVEANSENIVALISDNYSTNNICNYQLTTDDVGYRIKATYTGRDDFTGTSVSDYSAIVQKSFFEKPDRPLLISNTDDQLTIKFGTAGNKYDVGYAKNSSDSMTIIHNGVEGDTNVTIDGLNRNTGYYIYVRGSKTDLWEEGPWSEAAYLTTAKTNVSGDISITGTVQTAQELSFLVDNTNDQVGTWKLERVKDTGEVSTISPKSYTISNDTRTLTYTVQPQDASDITTNQIKATFIGNGNYQGTITKSTNNVDKAKLSIDNLPLNDSVVSEVYDHSFKVMTTSGLETYQFGYAKKGTPDITTVDGTVNANKNITINNLEHNTEYDLYIRKASKLGYEASDFVKLSILGKTAKSQLTGTVTYSVFDDQNNPVTDIKVGYATIGYTYHVNYLKGSYYPEIDDSTSGNWQWYLDGIAIEGANTDSYTVPAMLGTPEITVGYVAREDSDFKGASNLSIGTIEKATFEAPDIPTVTALNEDGEVGSKLEITTTNIEDVYWYVQKADIDSVPDTVLKSEVSSEIKTGVWFKAQTSLKITVDAYTDYVVYAAKLEDETHVSSSVVSQRAVKTDKENLETVNAEIKENNINIPWKVLQDKELKVDCNGKTAIGVWQFYVTSNPTDGEEKWQNIDLEVKSTLVEGVKDGHTYSNVQIPLKYLGNYVIVVFNGRGAYEGRIVYRANEKLIGTLLKGRAEVKGNDPTEALQTVNVEYLVPGQTEVDDKNGYWRWYRENDDGTYSLILDTEGNPYGKIGSTEDAYTTTKEDVGHKLYAEYNAQDEGNYTGTARTSILNAISRTEQNKPDLPEQIQVNGTDIQLKLPKNYKTDGTTIPEIVLGYRVKGSSQEITFQTDKLGETWINGLNANTEYEVYARFESTSEYLQSEISEAIIIKTGNRLFDSRGLVLNEDSNLVPGAKVKATFNKLGYNDGEFVVKRSDGTIANGTMEINTSKPLEISLTYTCTSEDIGSNLIVVFQAKADANYYGGQISKASQLVVKPASPVLIQAPTLSMEEYSETTLKAMVYKEYEYVLTTSIDAVVNESEWQKLTADNAFEYTFANLSVDTPYYLHARLSETENYRTGDEKVSAATKTWKSTLYAINYEGMEEASLEGNPTQYSELDTITLKAPKKKGYTFMGWTYYGQSVPNLNVTIPLHSTGSKTYTANWEIKSYTVSFDSKGGSPVVDETVVYDTLIPEPSTPTLKGYRFMGWFEDENYQKQWKFAEDRLTDKNMTLYAKWEINTYTATFDAMGGDMPEAIIKEYDSEWGTLPTSSRIGYTFIGWFTEMSGGTQVDSTTKVTDTDVTYYAHWQIIDYPITYHLGNAQSNNNPITYNVESATITLNDPIKDGSTFLGWLYDGEDEPQKNVVISQGSTGELEFTACWQLTNFTIDYDLDGGTNNNENPNTYTVDSSLIQLKAPRKDGQAFIGWTYEGQDTPIKDVSIATGSVGDKTFKAHWQTADYTVYFDTQGGNDIYPISVLNNTLLDEPEISTRLGYTFNGWYTEKELTHLWDFSQNKVNSDMTLYASWSINTLTITFDYQDNTTSSNNVNKSYGELLGSLVKPTRLGYTFKGWFTQASGGEQITAMTKVIQDTTYYAQWIPITYTLTYDLSGGSEVVKNPSYYTIETESFTLNAPYKEDSIFTGWTKQNGQTDSNITINKGSTGNQSFTANYTTADFKVNFISNGGSEVLPVYIKSGTSINEPMTPTRKGYNFIEWCSDEQLTQPYNFMTTITDNLTLYAKWSKENYNVVMNSMGGEGTPTLTREYGSEIGRLPVIKRSGYTFKGWFTQASGGEQITERTKLYENTEYFAQWEIIPYSISYDLNDGTNHLNNPNSYTVEDTLSLNYPSKVGYAFIGWSTPEDPQTIKDITLDKTTGDKQYIAHWQKADWTVNFETNGGTHLKSIEVIDGNTLLGYEQPTKTGYTFDSWYQDSQLTLPWDSENDVIHSDMTLYAKWTINQYVVRFDVLGGSTVPRMNVNYGEIGTLPTSNRTGYEFIGWYSHATAGIKINESTIINQDMTVYARWQLVNYHINYDLDGGVNAQSNPTSYTIQNNSIHLNFPTKQGYVFSGWTYKGQTTPTKDVTILSGSMGDINLKAHWINADSTVSFDTNGGNSISSMGVTNNSLMDYPETPVKYGYTFKGWYKDSNLSQEWNFNTDRVTTSMMLYAKWEINQYTITYDSMGGNEIASVTKDYLAIAGALPTPTKLGYTFIGWYSEKINGNKIDDHAQVIKDTTYYAHWSPINYSLNYELAGGKVTQNPSQYTIEEGININNPTKQNYVFAGWTYESQVTPVKDVYFQKGTTGNKTLTAHWVAAEYSVVYNSNGGSQVDTFYALTNDYLPRIEAPTKAGHTFIGWYKDENLTNAWDYENDVIDANYILHAKWEANRYQATFDGNGGSNGGDLVKTFGENWGTLPTSNRYGYTFTGWYDQIEGGNLITSETKVSAQNVTYYAHWQAVQYTITYNLAGGINHQDNPTQYTINNQIVIKAPYKVGSTFMGWSQNGSDTLLKEIIIPIGSTGELSFTAHYEANTYTVNFDSTIPPINVLWDDELTLQTPSKEGYTFVGWYDKTGKLINDKTTYSQLAVNDQEMNITLTSRWQQNRYTVKYDSMGGSSLADKTGITWFDSHLLPSQRPERVGYHFIGWVDDNNQLVSESTTYRSLAQTEKQSYITLHALWQVEETKQPEPNPTPPKPPVDSGNTVVTPIPPASEETKEEVVSNPKETQTVVKEVTGQIENGEVVLPKETTHQTINGNIHLSVGEGNIKVTISEKLSIKDMANFVNAVLTPEQLEKVAGGQTIEVKLDINIIKENQVEDLTLIEEKAKIEGLSLSTYYDITIQINENNQWVSVDNLNRTIEIVLDIPTALQSISDEFYVIHTHNGEVEILTDKDDNPKTITIEVKQFSTYVIAYKEKEEEIVKEKKNFTPWIIGTVFIVICGVSIYVYKKRKEDEETNNA